MSRPPGPHRPRRPLSAPSRPVGVSGRPRRLRRPLRQPPAGYREVDPRTAVRIRLSHELSGELPVFDGDPEFGHRLWSTLERDGYRVEQITSLGTHLGTHLDAPAHFVEGAADLADLDESWTLMPLVLLDLTGRAGAAPVDGRLGVDRLRRWEHRYGRIPVEAAVVLRTGSVEAGPAAGTPACESRPVTPGLSGSAVDWLFTVRRVRAIGSDAFGPDTDGDDDYPATRTALRHGGVVLAALGPGLARMRAHGDWIAANTARPAFSGFPVGVTGFTLR